MAQTACDMDRIIRGLEDSLELSRLRRMRKGRRDVALEKEELRNWRERRRAKTLKTKSCAQLRLERSVRDSNASAAVPRGAAHRVPRGPRTPLTPSAVAESLASQRVDAFASIGRSGRGSTDVGTQTGCLIVDSDVVLTPRWLRDASEEECASMSAAVCALLNQAKDLAMRKLRRPKSGIPLQRRGELDLDLVARDCYALHRKCEAGPVRRSRPASAAMAVCPTRSESLEESEPGRRRRLLKSSQEKKVPTEVPRRRRKSNARPERPGQLGDVATRETPGSRQPSSHQEKRALDVVGDAAAEETIEADLDVDDRVPADRILVQLGDLQRRSGEATGNCSGGSPCDKNERDVAAERHRDAAAAAEAALVARVSLNDLERAALEADFANHKEAVRDELEIELKGKFLFQLRLMEESVREERQKRHKAQRALAELRRSLEPAAAPAVVDESEAVASPPRHRRVKFADDPPE